MRAIFAPLLLLLSTSCAYLQTHKNVEETGAYYQGYLLEKNKLYVYHNAANDTWYVNAHRAKFRLHYPSVHDSVFRRKDDTPYFQVMSIANDIVYHPIRKSTAHVLTSPDGYMYLSVLAEDIQRGESAWKDSISTTSVHPVKAELPGEPTFQMPGTRVPFKKSLYARILGKADFIVVDIPGTLVYNIAIPIMVPFVFFHEFTSSDD